MMPRLALVAPLIRLVYWNQKQMEVGTLTALKKRLPDLLRYADEIGASEMVCGIVAQYVGGHTMRCIAEDLGMTQGGVGFHIHTFERDVSNYLSWRTRIKEERLLETTPELSQPQLRLDVVRDYAEGQSYSEVAAIHAITSGRVKTIVGQFLRDADHSGADARQATAGERIGERLRQLRQRRRLTVRELAAQVGISERTLYRYESGCPMRFRAMERLAQVYDVTLDWLLRGDYSVPF